MSSSCDLILFIYFISVTILLTYMREARELLLAAHELGMIQTKEYVFLTVDIGQGDDVMVSRARLYMYATSW